ncbi:MAG: hypothetical protein COC08_05875, partial [Maribacter sp.]
KVGLNYNSNGNLEDDLTSINISSDGAAGFHVGLFAEMKLPLFIYIRPEFVYTHTNSSYEFLDFSSDLTIDKIDAPILAGIRFLKIGRIFLGPSFQYIINSDLTYSDAFDEIKKVSSSDFSMGAQFGFGIELGKLGVDVRWERGLSDTEIKYIGMIDDELSNLTVDARPEQFILSIYSLEINYRE